MARIPGEKFIVNDFIFEEEIDTGGCCTPYDYNIWVSEKNNEKFSGCRT